jgi:hypothetical protein
MIPQSLRWTMAPVTAVSFLVMSYVDSITGYDFVFSAAYLIPTFLCAWFFGRRTIWLTSVASGLSSWLMDSGHHYSHSLIQYLNGFTCFLISLITGLLLHRLKSILQERKQMNIDLRKALEELERSTDEIRILQNGLQVVCAWTKQIKVGERWMAPEEFLVSQLHLKLTHGMSPEAGLSFEDGMQAQAAREPSHRDRTDVKPGFASHQNSSSD